MNETVIELKGLTKRYGYGDTESFALKDFDLTIKRGDEVFIRNLEYSFNTVTEDDIAKPNLSEYTIKK